MTVREEPPPPTPGNEVAWEVHEAALGGGQLIHTCFLSLAAVLETGRRAGLSESMLSLAGFVREVQQVKGRVRALIEK